MYKISVLLLLSVVLFASTVKSVDDFQTFKIDLDLDPVERFQETTTYFKSKIMKVFRKYMMLVPSSLENLFTKNENYIQSKQPEKFQEMVGIGQALGVNFVDLMILNYVYDVYCACTSIVAQQPDGTVLHGRNLDFAFADDSREIVYKGEFYKNGEHIFDAMMFAGDINVMTGFKSGAFSISLNARHVGDSTPERIGDWKNNMEMVFEGYEDIAWLIRDALIQANNFEEAMNILITTPIIAQGYLTVAGINPYEGAVITRSQFGLAHIEELSSSRWYVAQTNDDHFKGICQPRCQGANEHLTAIGQANISADTLLNQVMLANPNSNEKTIYTNMMIPKLNVFDAIFNDNDNPYQH